MNQLINLSAPTNSHSTISHDVLSATVKTLGLYRETASMETSSSLVSTTINVYSDDLRCISDILKYFHSNLKKTPQVHRVESVVQKITVLTERDIPFTVAPKSVDVQRGLGPVLSQLPGEIRNKIYSYLLSTGYPQFLRASKALHIEGSGLVVKDGIYRMSFRSDNRINYSLPSQRIVDTIRNLDIRADLTYYAGWPWEIKGKPDFWLLRAFGEPGRIRGRCSVFIELGPSTSEERLAYICTPLRLLSDFETVVVQVGLGWLSEPSSLTTYPRDSLLVKMAKAWFEQRETISVPWSVFKYRYVYEHTHLTHNLGEGHLEGGHGGGFRMVFHPRKALERAGIA